MVKLVGQLLLHGGHRRSIAVCRCTFGLVVHVCCCAQCPLALRLGFCIAVFMEIPPWLTIYIYIYGAPFPLCVETLAQLSH